MIRRKTLGQIWPEIEQGLNTVLSEGKSNKNEGISMKDWMKFYTYIHDYCTTTRSSSRKGSTGATFVGEALYDKLVAYLRDHMGALYMQGYGLKEQPLLEYYKKRWEVYTSGAKKVNSIFRYLNRHWIKRQAEDGKKEVYEVYILCLVIWRDYFFEPLKKNLTASLLSLIGRERHGDTVETALLKGVIDSYVSLGMNKERPFENTLAIYIANFEETFLRETKLFYAQESTSFIGSNSIPDYMKRVEQRLIEENHRIDEYLHDHTKPHLVKVLETELIDGHKERLWEDFPHLLEAYDGDNIDDLTRIYALLKRIGQDGLVPLRQSLEEYVSMVGDRCIKEVGIQAVKNPRQFIQALLSVHDKYATLVEQAFEKDVRFGVALDKACRLFINDNVVTERYKPRSIAAELLAKFSDLVLRRSSNNKLEDSQRERFMDDVMTIFKYIEEKDAFMAYYQKAFTRRLIGSTSASEHLESAMISKLKCACGFEHTAQLARMFNDIKISRDVQNDFFQALADPTTATSLLSSEKTSTTPSSSKSTTSKSTTSKSTTSVTPMAIVGSSAATSSITSKLLSVDFHCLILAKGIWPIKESPPLRLPMSLQHCTESFERFYTNRHSGRVLQWLHHMSRGEVRCNHTKRKYLLQCSTMQMVILCVFNTKSSPYIVNYREMAEHTNLPDEILCGVLKTLIRTKVVSVNPKLTPDAKDITPKHRFALNKHFQSPRMKININITPPHQRNEQQKVTQKQIEEGRKFEIQACIVRIMKMRKTLEHKLLVQEVWQQLKSRFDASMNRIKRCIDILIEKEYLERVEGKPDHYGYIA